MTPERCPNGTRLAPGHLWQFPEEQLLRVCLACGFEEPDDAFQRGYEAAREQAVKVCQERAVAHQATIEHQQRKRGLSEDSYLEPAKWEAEKCAEAVREMQQEQQP